MIFLVSDVNECSSKYTYDCSKPNRNQCLNKIGNYTCGCNEGFTLKGDTCEGRTSHIHRNTFDIEVHEKSKLSMLLNNNKFAL